MKSLSAAAAMLLVLVGSALADVVHLRDGTTVEGTVISRTDRLLRFKTTSGRVRTFRLADVKKVETAGAVLPEQDEAERLADDPLSKDTRRMESRMGRKLNVVVKGHVHVRGDHPHDELEKIADAGEMTLLHFMSTFDCDTASFIEGPGRYTGRIEVLQFRQEKAYLKFVDKVFAELRDSTVDDARLKLIRRQRGFWVMTPRPIMAGYMGPSPFETIPSNVSHKVSHELLMLWEPAGRWMPWWLLEGFAAWQEIQITGANLTYCLEPAGPGSYANQNGTGSADELAKAQTAKAWRKHIRKKLAAHEERLLGVLAKLPLNDLNRDEVIQSWSVVDWIDAKGKLKPFVLAYKRTNDLQTALEEVLGCGIDEAHERWRRWAAGRR
jgi:hypothetical protein